MIASTLGHIADVVGAGRPDIDPSFEGIATDTRRDVRGRLFVALRGATYDGNAFAMDALESGAACALLHGSGGPADPRCLRVPDSLTALGAIAADYRKTLAAKVIGVTGSAGKTSTRILIAEAVRATLTTETAEANFNNEIGLPLAICDADRDSEALVLELAMRAAGEIRYLAGIARPDVAVITRIGTAHIEFLGSRRAIAEAKAEILTELRPGGVAVLPADDAFLPTLLAYVPDTVRVITFAGVHGVDADVCLSAAGIDAEGRQLLEGTVAGTPVSTAVRMVGSHVAHNAAAALAVVAGLELDVRRSLATLAEAEPAHGRFEVLRGPRGITIIDDTYNASPESVHAALDALAEMPGVSKLAVLGDMRELGALTQSAHELVGTHAAAAGLRGIAVVGPNMRDAAERARSAGFKGEIWSFATTAEAAASVRDIVRDNDVILVKGARAMEMERVVTALTCTETHAIAT